MKVGIMGAGRFGTALATRIALSGKQVVLQTTTEDILTPMLTTRENPRLPGVTIHENILPTSELSQVSQCDVIVLAVASTDAPHRLRLLAPFVDGRHVLVHAIGAFAANDQTISELIQQETPIRQIGVLAGPALYRDLLEGNISSMVVASRFTRVIDAIKDGLSAPPALRIYGSQDLIGVELASALACSYSITVGLGDQLGLGPGPRASLITRSLAEAARFIGKVGGNPSTPAGLAGIGNLLVRTDPKASAQSLDYLAGKAVGKGTPPSEVPITEGVRVAEAGMRLAVAHGIRAPILQTVHSIFSGDLSVEDAVTSMGESVSATE